MNAVINLQCSEWNVNASAWVDAMKKHASDAGQDDAATSTNVLLIYSQYADENLDASILKLMCKLTPFGDISFIKHRKYYSR